MAECRNKEVGTWHEAPCRSKALVHVSANIPRLRRSAVHVSSALFVVSPLVVRCCDHSSSISPFVDISQFVFPSSDVDREPVINTFLRGNLVGAISIKPVESSSASISLALLTLSLSLMSLSLGLRPLSYLRLLLIMVSIKEIE